MKASILLPVYNAGLPLHLEIDSILRQDEPDFELLIIDNCSRDRSPEVIRGYASRDPRIRVFQALVDANGNDSLHFGSYASPRM